MSFLNKIKLIAEVGLSHNGNLTLAHSYIDSAAKAGAQAIKFQTHYADEESSIYDKFRKKNKYIKYDTRFDYWKKTEFSFEEWRQLKKHADEKKIIFFSSPFSNKAVSVLNKIGVKIWKIASGELSNHPLIEKIASLKQSIILSTGMSDYHEIDETLNIIRKYHNKFALAQCTSLYPCPPDKLGLNLINEFKKKYNCSVGFSDHSGNSLTPLLARTFGADFIELHVVYDKNFIGFDTETSVTFQELREIAKNINYVDNVIKNKLDKTYVPKEIAKNKFLFQKSIFSNKNLKKNTKLKLSNLSFKKPAKGIPVKEYKQILGKKLKRDVKINTLIKKSNIF